MFCTFWHEYWGGAQLWSCSHLVDHTSIPFIYRMKSTWSKSCLKDQRRHFIVHHFLQLLWYENPKGYSCTFFFFEMAHLSCFKIVWINHILTSKHVHANYTTNLNEMDSKQPFWRLTTQNNSFDQSISLGKWVKCMCNPLDRNTQELSTSTNS